MRFYLCTRLESMVFRNYIGCSFEVNWYPWVLGCDLRLHTTTWAVLDDDCMACN
jgi:hypothetical protein